ncbi:hypothetical protein LINPERPRIM_LOCUS32834 [Linum perenne]
MGVFYQEEEPSPPNPSKKCKLLLASTLRDVFSNCKSCGGRISSSSPLQDEDYVATTDLEDEQEVVLSAIRTRAMEKSKSKSKHKAFVITDSFSGELFSSPKRLELKHKNGDDGDMEEDEFFSVGSYLSCCSSVLSREEFLSVKTNLSRCSSFSKVEEFPSLQKRVSILQELCHCEGWPFGLCRKAVLLPPLPKSPSESWLWRKGTRSVRLP